MPEPSARNTTRRVSIGRVPITDDEPFERRPGTAIIGRLAHAARRSGRSIAAGTCRCIEPITDAAIDARIIGLTTTDDDDDELCWRCHRPILSEE